MFKTYIANDNLDIYMLIYEDERYYFVILKP